MALMLLLCHPACLWRGYEDIMRVHLEVLSGMAAKVVAVAGTGRRPRPNDIIELTYPLQRARQFARQYEDYSERRSYRLFVACLDRYEYLVLGIDAARGEAERWAVRRTELPAQHAALAQAMEQVRAALASES